MRRWQTHTRDQARQASSGRSFAEHEDGVYKKKSLYGREFMGIERTTFIIDKAGVVRRVFPKVKVNGHTEEVIEALKELS